MTKAVLTALRRPDFWLGCIVVVAVGGGLMAAGVLSRRGGSGAAATSASKAPASVSERGQGAAAREPSAAGSNPAGEAQEGPQARAGMTGSAGSESSAAWVDDASLRERVGEIAAARGASVGVAVRGLDEGEALKVGSLQSGPAWSTMKVPVILARYRLAESRGQSTAPLRARVAAAVTTSDNAAVQSLFDEIAAATGGVAPASSFVQEGLRAVGDEATTVNTVPPPGGFSTFGQTEWSLAEGTRFYAALAGGCAQPPDADTEILALMGRVVREQSWGLGQAHFAAVDRVLFKGGWGPDPGGRYLVRQFGVVRTASDRGFVVGLMAQSADGSFSSGVEVLNKLADAVAQNSTPAAAPATGTC